MRIDMINPAPVEPMTSDKVKHLRIGRRGRHRHLPKRFQKSRSVLEIAERQFAHDERMDKHPALFQQPHKHRVGSAKMSNPDRTIDQDHAA